ncbi:MAG: TniQ family protein [Desulforhabdus sp.]|jgi:hypothetical protein|nr:TniQ family protein [Desulforhabdus sp.]
MKKLLYRPLPEQGEGLNGYLCRVRAGNLLSGKEQIFGAPIPRAGTIVALLGLDHERELTKPILLQLAQSGSSANPLWNRKTARFCPTCLEEERLWRREWELSLYTCCHEHGHQLHDCCPGCGTQVTWRRRLLLECDCGFRFASSIPVDAGDGERWLADRLAILGRKPRGLDEDHLQLMSLEELHRVAVYLGAYATGKKTSKPLKIACFSSLGSIRPVAHAAGDILSRWPDGFHQLLDRVRDEFGQTGAEDSLSAQFGHFYGYLYKQFKEPAYGFMTHAFGRYIEESWKAPLTERNRRLSQTTRGKHVWISIKTAAKALGTSRPRIVSFIEEGKIEGHTVVSPRGRKSVFVDRRQLPLMKGLLERVVDLRTAASMLGINELRVKELINAETFLKGIPPKARRASRWAISRFVVDTLLQWDGMLPVFSKEEAANLISLNAIFRFHIRRRLLFPKLMGAILHDEVSVKGRLAGYEGLSGWLFERKPVIAWIRAKTKGVMKGAVTVSEAAQRLEVKEETAYLLVRKEILKVVYEQPYLRQMVRLEEIERFKSEYIFGARLAELVGSSPKEAARLLASEDVLPVIGPSVGAGRYNVFKRGEQLEEVIDRVKQILGNSQRQC